MTKKEACDIERSCEELLYRYLNRPCSVSLALTGKLKISFDDNFITLNDDYETVDFIKFFGWNGHLQDTIDTVKTCIKDNKELFNTLIWSYEHIRELEDEE